MTKSVAIVSGGLDSSVMAYWLASIGNELTMLTFDYGQRHRREIDSAKKIAKNLFGDESVKRHHIIDISGIGKLLSGSSLTDADVNVPDGHYQAETMKITVVPNRNAIMLSIAFGIAAAINADYVEIANHSGDHFIYPDCRPEFISAFREMERKSLDTDYKTSLSAPFMAYNKATIVEIGIKLGVPFEDTWSCYKGGEHHCGVCGTCTERREAFEKAGAKDPTKYLSLVKHY